MGSIVLLLLSLPAFSQLNFGSIAGSVTDQTGAVIPGTKVTVIDVARGVSRPLVADEAGQYTAPGLTPGEYTVRAEQPGFQTVERAKIIVGVGQSVRIDLQLQAGGQAESVTVTEAAPLVDASNEVISNTVDSLVLAELPINGRLYTKVLDFQPGIYGRPGGGSPTYQANGACSACNYWMLDGVENVNMWVNSGPLIGAATSTDELTILPADAVQEVNVMANPPAEFGWFQGGVVNVGLKSGTNAIHGSVYGFGRNNAFEAYNPYQNGITPTLPKSADNFWQYGASLSGPIVKDRLFYFGNYEGMRYKVGAPTLISIPTVSRNALSANDSLPLAIESLVARGVTPSQLSLNLAGCTVTGGVASCDPAAGIFTNASTITQNMPVALNNVGSSNNVIGKIDYHLNDRNTINGEYFFGNSNTDQPTTGAAPWWINGNHNRTQMNRGVWIYTPNSSWVNEVRFGWNRYGLVDYNAECTRQVGQPNYAQLGFVSGANPPSPMCGFPIVNITGSQGFAGLGSGAATNDTLVNQQTETVYDNASYIRGTHQLKFGFEYHHTAYNGLGSPGNFDGTLNFDGGVAFSNSTALQDFLAGKPNTGSILVNPQYNSLNFNRYAGYLSDDFRLTQKLTVNLGLRYELEPAILVDHNNAANFDPASPTGMVQQNGKPLYNTDHHDFAPRAGFAWDITGKAVTVFRAGMGVSYDTPQLDNLIAYGFGAGLNNIPTGFTLYNPDGSVAFAPSTAPGAVATGQVTLQSTGLNWATGVPVFNVGPSALACGNGLVRVANGTTPSPCNIHGKSVNAPRSPMYTWTVGVQHAFTNSTSLTVNYVGTHAYNLSSMINVNEPTPGASKAVAGSKAGGTTGSYQFRQPYYSQFPWLGGIFLYGPKGFSNFNALQVTLTQRAFHGPTMKTNYSFSKDLATPKGGNSPYTQDGRNPAAFYGPWTPAHHLGIIATYALPGKKSFGQLLQGWEVNSSINMLSGPPANPSDTSNDLTGIGMTKSIYLAGTSGGTSGVGEQWSLVGNRRNFDLGKTTSTPCYSFPGGKFAGNPACSPLSLAGNNGAGQACINAANALPVNGQMNAEIPGSSSGLASLQKFGCYVSANGKSILLPPAQGTFGNMGANALFGAAFRTWDFSVIKKWSLNERAAIQFRAEFYNLMNNRTFSGGTTSLTNPATFGLATAAPNARNPINGTGGPREVQFGLKATF
jgi:hypothetical protein